MPAFADDYGIATRVSLYHTSTAPMALHGGRKKGPRRRLPQCRLLCGRYDTIEIGATATTPLHYIDDCLRTSI